MDQKKVEIQVNRVLYQFILSSVVDIRTTWEADDPYPGVESREFLDMDAAAKKAIKKKPPAFCSINSEMKQVLAKIFQQMTAEIMNTDPTKMIQIASKTLNGTEDNLLSQKYKNDDEKAQAAAEVIEFKQWEFLASEAKTQNELCVIEFMVEFVRKFVGNFLPRLKSDSDKEAYFGTKVTQLLSMHKENPMLLNLATKLFYQFLKCLAFIVARFVWYDKVTLNQSYILGTLNQMGMGQQLLDYLENSIRPRAKKELARKLNGAEKRKKRKNPRNLKRNLKKNPKNLKPSRPGKTRRKKMKMRSKYYICFLDNDTYRIRRCTCGRLRLR
jgi:hypothetical protein